MYTEETSFDACTDFPIRVNPQVMEAVEILPEACFTEKKKTVLHLTSIYKHTE
ncbi:hypothetical protein AALA44_10300 [Enterococcus ratti]|uniref:hypothetical protein n=1 Tax=Enterococcus ratti TaxID=150033 RepID=UPI0035165876